MRFDTDAGPLDVEVAQAVVAGWTGRDSAAVEHHIAELAAIGVAPPSTVPLFYRVSASLLAQAPEIEVVGEGTSGEVEPLIVRNEGALWLGLGSDHTDRELEAYSVAASKQACPKPIAGTLWRFSQVEPHLDRLTLRCHIEEAGQWVLYQDGSLAAIRPLAKLIDAANLGENSAMLCGTLAAIGGVRPAARYRMELADPVLGRSIILDYATKTLPNVA